MNERFNEDGLILSGRYRETMEEAVLPFLKEREKDVTVNGDGGKRLFCSVFSADQPRGTAVVLHGFTENAFKFSEIIYSLLQNGFSVIAYDQRGHGRSWRDEKIADYSLTHVSDFNEYVRDLEAVCETQLKKMPKPWVIFAHSMGGAVACLYLERHPGVFGKAALCAPMIAANVGMPCWLVKAMCQGARLLGKGKKRVFVSKPYSGPESFEESCATGKERFDWYDAVKEANREYHNNGPSYSWTLEAIKASKWLLEKGAPEKIDCPVLLCSADKDNSVMPEPQEAFIKRVPKGKRILVKGSRHEIFRSSDDVLFPWWHEVLQFLKT